MTQNIQLMPRENQSISMPSESEFNVMRQQSEMLIKTGFLPKAIDTPEKAMAIILTGRELGIPTMCALRSIDVINGKPTVSPQLMMALIERSGQLENKSVKQTDNAIVCTLKRRGRDAHSETFGFAEAKNLGLDQKDNYKKQPFTMFRWRAVAACARVVFPDVILGLYTPEEMGSEYFDEAEPNPSLDERASHPRIPTKTNLIEAAKLPSEILSPAEISLREQLDELYITQGYTNNAVVLAKFDALPTLEAKEDAVGLVRAKTEAKVREAQLIEVKTALAESGWEVEEVDGFLIDKHGITNGVDFATNEQVHALFNDLVESGMILIEK